MNQLIFILITSCLCFPRPDLTKHQSEENKYEYWAAKYSMPVDYAKTKEIVFGFQDYESGSPKVVVSYHYYIQYGKNIVFDILDPGNGMEFIGFMLIKWDYSNHKFTHTHCMDLARKYRTSTDTITLSIEKNNGSLINLCNGEALGKECDSVNFKLNSDNKVFKIHFNYAIPNITTPNLFYPDIQNLPTKIDGLGYENNTSTLDEIIYGKESVDSLLQLFSCDDGYDVYTDEELNAIDTNEIRAMIDKVKHYYEKSGKDK